MGYGVKPAVKDPRMRAIFYRHKPVGWKVRFNRRGMDKQTWGMAYGETKTIACSSITDITTLLVFLHECGHVHRGHLDNRSNLASYMQEYEAEIYAIHSLRAEGYEVPEWLLEAAKQNVMARIHEDRENGVSISTWVERWAKVGVRPHSMKRPSGRHQLGVPR